MTDARVHAAAARGFASASDAYARGRPGCPPAVAARLAAAADAHAHHTVALPSTTLVAWCDLVRPSRR